MLSTMIVAKNITLFIEFFGYPITKCINDNFAVNFVPFEKDSN